MPGCPAHLVTLNRDGSPQVTLVWISLDGDEVVAGHLPRNRKVRNMENPPAGYVTRIRVDRIEGVGPWTGRPV
jgi:hypothetical protein